jgi:hypothetical protein
MDTPAAVHGKDWPPEELQRPVIRHAVHAAYAMIQPMAQALHDAAGRVGSRFWVEHQA